MFMRNSGPVIASTPVAKTMMSSLYSMPSRVWMPSWVAHSIGVAGMSGIFAEDRHQELGVVPLAGFDCHLPAVVMGGGHPGAEADVAPQVEPVGNMTDAAQVSGCSGYRFD
jgi:hypothetical protein